MSPAEDFQFNQGLKITFLRKVTYSKVQGVRPWACLGTQSSACCRRHDSVLHSAPFQQPSIISRLKSEHLVLCWCERVRVCVCMHVHVCLCTYVCMHTCTCVYMKGRGVGHTILSHPKLCTDPGGQCFV